VREASVLRNLVIVFELIESKTVKKMGKLSRLEEYEMWKCGKAGMEVGCAQGCEETWGTKGCWECPDPNAPTHAQIEEYEKRVKNQDGENK
jgi:hypothetical protein